ncbi:MAG: FtsQ-type POTRA domain-containing protein [Acidobacteria bacterium]|nr:MAG: FtsQ-type POTRA domain-containing protein [Acidobacteriota bacterium]
MSLTPRALPSAGVSAPADKRFRRAETRPGRGGAGWLRSRALRWGALALLAIGVSAAGFIKLARLGVFTVDRIVVHGNARLSTGEVLTLVDGLRGESVFAADFEKYRTRLLDSPWVADATMRRVLPSTIDLRVIERAPIAIGRLGDQLFLVDPSGVIIDEYGPQYAQYDLPIVDGLVASPAAGGPAVDLERARLVARFVDALATMPNVRQHISQVDVSDAHNLVAILDQDPVALRLGDRDFAARLQRYLELAPSLKEQIREIDAVDLRFDERIPVSRKPAATVASRTAAVAAKGKH